MYHIGELIIYGNTGVCHIENICKENFGATDPQLYYCLKPRYQNGTIYAPVDGGKVFMRPVISRTEAEQLMERIPTLEPDPFHSRNVHELTTHYKDSLENHTCETLIEMVMSIYNKKEDLKERKQKFGQTDNRYMKYAENMLNEELAVALDIPVNQVSSYIAAKVNNAKLKTGGFKDGCNS